ncbi:hypothetical protein DYB32_003498 [Aphanomyces invadans]|uniref:PDZ domain-containing protein n=1 Tax=Aphanomyces invadans TaxID=157072 RepID=A0A3R6VNV9_9STRA|nr:hypothetical protein DYB32_003498 [Aphanomyces invadans]
MNAPRPSASAAASAMGGPTGLLPTRLLRTLHTWKASGSRVLTAAKYADYAVVDGDDDLAMDQMESPELATSTTDDLPVLACRLATSTTSTAGKSAPPSPEAPSPAKGVFDVLLQKDANGLGFCLAVDDRTHEALLVTSFRRLHAGDIGPAEASKTILPGDALLAINGEPVYSLQQVQSKVTACDESAFVLLRFRRGAPRDNAAATVRPAATAPPRPPHTTMSQRELQMATTLHDMAKKSELLLSQLSDANMKVTAQTREIDALRAEVLQLRLDRDMQAQSASRGWTHGLTRPAAKASAKHELDVVVTEAHNELKRSAVQHLQAEKDAIRADARRQMDEWKLSVLKKQAMLEEALLFMVDHVDEWASQPKDTSSKTTSIPTKGPSLSKHASPIVVDARVAQIRAILDKYYASRQVVGHADLPPLSLVQSPPTPTTAPLA